MVYSKCSLIEKKIMNNTKIVTREYDNNTVAFELLDNTVTMVNLTQMAKAFKKKTNDWLRLDGTKEYLDEYFYQSGIPRSETEQILKVVNGGNNNGTWANQDIALYFAQWLSPKFHIWCNKQIKELLTTGKVELKPKSALELAREQVYLLEQLEEKTKQLELQKPKVEFADQLLQSTQGMDLGMCAKAMNLPFGRNKLFSILRDNKILMKNNSPYQNLVDLGYFMLLEQSWINPKDQSSNVSFKTLITTKGQEWLTKKFKDLGYI